MRSNKWRHGLFHAKVNVSFSERARVCVWGGLEFSLALVGGGRK